MYASDEMTGTEEKGSRISVGLFGDINNEDTVTLRDAATGPPRQ
jgi:hypothetical protein